MLCWKGHRFGYELVVREPGIFDFQTIRDSSLRCAPFRMTIFARFQQSIVICNHYAAKVIPPFQLLESGNAVREVRCGLCDYASEVTCFDSHLNWHFPDKLLNNMIFSVRPQQSCQNHLEHSRNFFSEAVFLQIYTEDQICGSQTAWNPCFCP